MPVQRLKELLDRHEVRYVTLSHSPAFTAQEVAAAVHISGRELAKVVMVKLDGTMVMTVLPASHRIDLEQLAEVTGSKRAEVATEQEFETLFPGCDVGGMPPFGRLWHLPMVASEALLDRDEIAFNAGNHTEVMIVGLREWVQIAEPKLLSFSVATH